MHENTLTAQNYQWQLLNSLEVNSEKFQHRNIKDGNIENHHVSQEVATYLQFQSTQNYCDKWILNIAIWYNCMAETNDSVCSQNSKVSSLLGAAKFYDVKKIENKSKLKIKADPEADGL